MRGTVNGCHHSLPYTFTKCSLGVLFLADCLQYFVFLSVVVVSLHCVYLSIHNRIMTRILCTVIPHTTVPTMHLCQFEMYWEVLECGHLNLRPCAVRVNRRWVQSAIFIDILGLSTFSLSSFLLCTHSMLCKLHHKHPKNMAVSSSYSLR